MPIHRFMIDLHRGEASSVQLAPNGGNLQRIQKLARNGDLMRSHARDAVAAADGRIFGTSTMGLNIKNAEVERLASEIARATGETKTEAIRKALEERRVRMGLPTLAERIAAFEAKMEREIWSKFPQDALRPVTKDEYDALFE
jgi:antitoxin VapB